MITLRRVAHIRFGAIVGLALAMGIHTFGQTKSAPVDPGVRGGPAGGGFPLKGLTADETAFFKDGLARFAEIEVVTGGTNNGLGPRFNSNQCLSCHSQPGAKSLNCSRYFEWGEEHCAMVHHAKWSGPRSAV